MSDMTEHSVRDLLVHYLKRGERLEWLEWLPMAELAANSVDEFIGGYNMLDADRRGDFLLLLRRSQSGPLAELILMALAANASLIEDGQERDFVLEDAQDACLRVAERLRFLQEAVSLKNAQLHRAENRLTEGFSLAGELIAMEMQLHQLRSSECELDDDISSIHRLERQIMNLEMRSLSLKHYDRVTRTGYRDQLSAAMAEEKVRNDELEEKIAGLESALTKIREKKSELASLHAGRQAELDAVVVEAEHEQAEISELVSEIEKRNAEIESLRSNRSRMLAEEARLEDQQREAQELARRAESMLDEIVRSARANGHAELIEKVRGVYDLLPPDLADQSRR